MRLILSEHGKCVGIVDHLEERYTVDQFACLVAFQEMEGRDWHIEPDVIVNGDYPAYQWPELGGKE